jgi:hypothetical protein
MLRHIPPYPEWILGRARPARGVTRFLGAAVVAGGLALAFAVTARAQQPIVIKFSHVTTPDTPKGKGAERFKELAEKYTGGRVKVEVYPNSQLYKDKEEIEALQLGAVQMLAPATARLSARPWNWGTARALARCTACLASPRGISRGSAPFRGEVEIGAVPRS